MKEFTIQCSRCCRSCMIRMIENEDRHYIGGNKCIGGEQTIREAYPHLEQAVLRKEIELHKKGFFHKLLSGLKRSKQVTM